MLLLVDARAAETIAVKELMDALASAHSSHATFVETRHSALLKTPLVLRGTLAYRRPDFMEKRVLHPYDERIVLEGETLTLESRARSIKMSTASGPAGIVALVDGIRAIRAGDLAAVERHFEVSVAGPRDRWSMTLKPANNELARYLNLLAVSGSGSRITRVDVAETNGDRAIMELEEQIK